MKKINSIRYQSQCFQLQYQAYLETLKFGRNTSFKVAGRFLKKKCWDIKSDVTDSQNTDSQNIHLKDITRNRKNQRRYCLCPQM